MPCFVKKPYFPTAKVTHILAGTALQSYEKALSDFQIACIYSKPIDNLDISVKNHLDLAVFPCGSKDFILDSSQSKLFETLTSLGARPQYSRASATNGYPQEAWLNCVRIGNRLLGNPKTVDIKILEYCQNHRVSICTVKQGYTKCSVAVVSENALITDDTGIARAAERDKLDVLLVKKGSVRLNGYPYGFVGGCCSLISKDMMLFIGNWKMHTNAEAISAFLRNYHIYPESLSSDELTDIGSFIPLFQQEEIV